MGEFAKNGYSRALKELVHNAGARPIRDSFLFVVAW